MSSLRWQWEMGQRRAASEEASKPYFKSEVRHHPEPGDRQRPNSRYRLGCDSTASRLQVLSAAADTACDQLEELIAIYFVVPVPPGSDESVIKIWEAAPKRQGGDWTPEADKVFRK